MGFKPKKGPFSLIFLVTKQERSKNKSQIYWVSNQKMDPFQLYPKLPHSWHQQSHRHSLFHYFVERERERERENYRSEKKKGSKYTYIHTHIDRERERDEIFFSFSFFLFFGFWVWKRRVMGGLEEKGFGFGRETVGCCSTGKKKKF